ncbi:aminopeptidase P family protein [Acetobacter sp. TBRC 12305]|uniref:Aminopeptidase P family protein n=1 Tax=Acetobacter garciniae TaxID=2817435 RepID=A0A939HN87_9PROT|nr:M24 family metallopeptidase [Acetobacter garciniae]MBO1326130.1 aminopeptidase P family protein [Acetobacter garciniae]MBX0345126.1 aminopeptidase P family protein [Acetobacter garciniae]
MTATPHSDDARRAASLLAAQDRAVALFEAIGRELVRPGVTESALSEEIYALAEARFGVSSHWHRRVVRSGPHTLLPYVENPADRMIAPDDILFVDLGPIFDQWEADFGRTFVLGNDPDKLRLRDSLAPVFDQVSAEFDAHPDITGEELYARACAAAERAGWRFGGSIAGHLVGDFPHETIPGDRVASYIMPGSTTRLRGVDASGRALHWILEIHLVDREKQIGGFYEQLLTVREPAC